MCALTNPILQAHPQWFIAARADLHEGKHAGERIAGTTGLGMRYADAYTQQQLERVTTGRPANSAGWGKLVAVKTGAYVSGAQPP